MPEYSLTYAEEVSEDDEEEGDEEESDDEESDDEEEGDEEEGDEEGDEEEGDEDEEEVIDEEDFDDLDDEDFDDEESGDEENSLKVKVENLLDFLDQNRDMKLIAEQFIYPFNSDGHKAMLSKNLVSSVLDVGSFSTTEIRKKGKKGKSRGRAKGKFVSIGTKGVRSKFSGGRRSFSSGGGRSLSSVSRSSTKDKKGGKPEAPVVMPPFEISGKFGIRNVEYIIIGNRFYTIDQKLKGSRALKKVVVTGIDDQLAYFAYKDREFQKKIQAMKRIF